MTSTDMTILSSPSATLLNCEFNGYLLVSFKSVYSIYQMPKRPLALENKENDEPSSSTEPIPAKKSKPSEEEHLQPLPSVSSEEEEEEEEDEPLPIAAVIEHNEGTVHPNNKEYFIYPNVEPSMISKTARFWSRKYLKVLRHVNPDAYGMYIHNDFVCYGELEVIENCLLDLAKGIFLKRKGSMSFTHYVTAFRRLEALLIVLGCADSLSMIDDGERFEEIIRVVGACCVTVLRDLLPESMFNDKNPTENEMKKLTKIAHQIPNFQDVLKHAIILGYHLLTIGDTFSAFTNILQRIYCKWSLIIEKVVIDINEKNEGIWQALKHASDIEEDDYDESFNFLEELAQYSSNHPGLGGNSHDLRRWSMAQRKLYSFDRENDDDDDDDDAHTNFWFRL